MEDKTEDMPEYKFDEAEEASYDASTTDQPANVLNAETAAFEPSDSASQEPSAEIPDQSAKLKINIKKIDMKKLIVPLSIVGAIVVLFMAFIIFSPGEKPSAEEQIAMMDTSALPQRLPAAKTKVTVPPVSDVVTTTPSISEPTSEQMSQMVAAVKQQIDAIKQQITNNQGNISDLGEMLYKVQQDLSAITKQMEQFTLFAQQAALEIDSIKNPKPKTKKVAKIPVAYYVRAVVPGRVWLESADGKSVTLRVGDKLKGYGVVQAISPRQGMVVMSNGAVLQYGVNDF